MKILIKLNWTHMCIGKLFTTFLLFASFFHEKKKTHTNSVNSQCAIALGKRLKCFAWDGFCTCIFAQPFSCLQHYTNLFLNFSSSLTVACVYLGKRQRGKRGGCVHVSEWKVFRWICWWFKITLRTKFYLAVLLFENENWPSVSHSFCKTFPLLLQAALCHLRLTISILLNNLLARVDFIWALIITAREFHSQSLNSLKKLLPKNIEPEFQQLMTFNSLARLLACLLACDCFSPTKLSFHLHET